MPSYDDSGGPRTATADGASNAPTARDDDVVQPENELPTIDPVHYTIQGEIARGGMGRIRAAIDRRLGREVAIKELLRGDPKLVARFEREALVTARLQHPSIVGVYEAGRWPTGEPFYAMRRVRGRPLKQLIAETPTLDGRLVLLPHVLAAADAIAYAHDLRIIHRDLKPSNIIVGEFGETVVIDWGLVKDLNRVDGEDSGNDDAALTRAGAVIGTAHYMPPEQAEGRPVDERADVYALGAMLYHLLAGDPPYRGNSVEILAQLTSGPPARLADAAPDAPRDLVAIVERAMARDCQARYPTARALADDLRKFTTGQLVASHRYTLGQLLARVMRRYRAALAVAAVAVIAIAVIGAIAIRRIVDERDRADGERTAARLRADELLVQQATELVTREPWRVPALLGELSPGSSHLPAARVIASDVRARRLGRELSGHTDTVVALAVSDDSRWMATASSDRTIRLWNLATFEGRVIGSHDTPLRAIAISGDGAIVASAAVEDRAVRIWNTRDGTATAFVHEAPVSGVILTTDARRLLTFSEVGPNQLWDLPAQRVVSELPKGLIAFAPRETRETLLVYGAGAERQIGALDLETGALRIIGKLPGMREVAIARGGDTVAWQADDDTLWRFDRVTGAQRALGVVAGKRCTFGISPDRAFVASYCNQRHAIWDDTGSTAIDQVDHEPIFVAPQLSTSATLVLAAPRGYTDPPTKHVMLVDRSSRHTYRLAVPDPSHAWQLTPDDRFVVAIAGSSAWVWPTRDATRVVAAGAKPANFKQAIVLRDGRGIALGSGGLLVIEGKPEPIEIPMPVGRIAIAPDERSLAVLGTDGTVHLVDLATAAKRALAGTVDVRLRARPPDPDPSSPTEYANEPLGRRNIRRQLELVGRIQYLAFSPDGRWLAAAAPPGGRLHVWELATGDHHSFKTRADAEALAFVGDRLAIGRSDGTIELYAPRDRNSVTLEGHEGPIEDLAVAAGMLASGDSDGRIAVWDLAARRPRFLAYRAGLVHLALSPDGKTLAAAYTDRTTALWDVATGKRRTLLALDRPVERIAFADDGKSLALAGDDGAFACDVASTRCRQLFDKPVFDIAMYPRGAAILGVLPSHAILWPDELPRDEAGLRGWLARPQWSAPPLIR